jgi:hypothetical protein
MPSLSGIRVRISTRALPNGTNITDWITEIDTVIGLAAAETT